MIRLLFIAFTLLFWPTSNAANDSCDGAKKNIPAEIVEIVGHYLSLGASASGEELANELWRLGTSRPEYGAYMQSRLSNEQLMKVYFYKVDKALLESNSLSDEQYRFIEQSKEVIYTVFNEDRSTEEEVFEVFFYHARNILGDELASEIYGPLWPRIPSDFDKTAGDIKKQNIENKDDQVGLLSSVISSVSDCNCAVGMSRECNYSPALCTRSNGKCIEKSRGCGFLGRTRCDGYCANIY
jgi:hypothetical protein